MRVTASHIVDWANTHAKEAQNDLPRLVRRLCFLTGSTRQLAFPAGDSTYVPGWDGRLFGDQGNAWVPMGLRRQKARIRHGYVPQHPPPRIQSIRASKSAWSPARACSAMG